MFWYRPITSFPFHIHFRFSQSNFQSFQPTSSHFDINEIKKIFAYMKRRSTEQKKSAVCIFIFCNTQSYSEYNHQVSLFLPTVCLQYVNHGRNDVRSLPLSSHLATHSSTSVKCWSQTSLSAWCSSVKLSRLK